MKWRDERGFDVIELMIVISAVAVLAAVVIPKLIKHFEEQKKEQQIAEGIIYSAECTKTGEKTLDIQGVETWKNEGGVWHFTLTNGRSVITDKNCTLISKEDKVKTSKKEASVY